MQNMIDQSETNISIENAFVCLNCFARMLRSRYSACAAAAEAATHAAVHPAASDESTAVVPPVSSPPSSLLRGLWVHLDVDSFYTAAFSASRPELLGKPVAVTQFNSGGFVAVNQDAKRHKIRKGDGIGAGGHKALGWYANRPDATMASVRARCPDLVVLAMDTVLFRSVSLKLLRVIEDIARSRHATGAASGSSSNCVVEKASIDDFYVWLPASAAASWAQTGDISCEIRIVSGASQASTASGAGTRSGLTVASPLPSPAAAARLLRASGRDSTGKPVAAASISSSQLLDGKLPAADEELAGSSDGAGKAVTPVALETQEATLAAAAVNLMAALRAAIAVAFPGMTVGCAAARNRLLAKLCSPLAKPDGAVLLLPSDAGTTEALLSTTPIQSVPGLKGRLGTAVAGHLAKWFAGRPELVAEAAINSAAARVQSGKADGPGGGADGADDSSSGDDDDTSGAKATSSGSAGAGSESASHGAGLSSGTVTTLTLTLGMLRHVPPATLQSWVPSAKKAAWLRGACYGTDATPITPYSPPQQIISERSFPPLQTWDQLRQWVRTLGQQLLARLIEEGREQGRLPVRLLVQARTGYHSYGLGAGASGSAHTTGGSAAAEATGAAASRSGPVPPALLTYVRAVADSDDSTLASGGASSAGPGPDAAAVEPDTSGSITGGADPATAAAAMMPRVGSGTSAASDSSVGSSGRAAAMAELCVCAEKLLCELPLRGLGGLGGGKAALAASSAGATGPTRHHDDASPCPPVTKLVLGAAYATSSSAIGGSIGGGTLEAFIKRTAGSLSSAPPGGPAAGVTAHDTVAGSSSVSAAVAAGASDAHHAGTGLEGVNKRRRPDPVPDSKSDSKPKAEWPGTSDHVEASQSSGAGSESGNTAKRRLLPSEEQSGIIVIDHDDDVHASATSIDDPSMVAAPGGASVSTRDSGTAELEAAGHHDHDGHDFHDDHDDGSGWVDTGPDLGIGMLPAVEALATGLN